MAVIGIDLGGTKIFGVRMDDGEVVADAKVKTPVLGGPMAIVDAIAKVAADLDSTAEGLAVGVGAPGVVDVATGVVRAAPNLPGWIEPFPLGQALAEALGGATVVVDNDVNVGTLAEQRQGAARGADQVLGVFVGTGVGGGIVLDGRLRRGPTGLAGEIGHMVVTANGRRCGCGGRGHLEAYAGRAGMERQARKREANGHHTLLVDSSKARRMTSSVWARALAAKDDLAGELVEEAVGALGRAVGGVVTTLDLELVVVGGGLADRLGPQFVARIEQAVRRDLFVGAGRIRGVPAELGEGAGAIGAALLAADAAARPAGGLAVDLSAEATIEAVVQLA